MLWVPKESCDIEKLREELTVVPKYDNLTPIETFIETQDSFGIPRNYIELENIVDRRVTGKKADINFKGTLRPVQKEVITDWKKLCTAGKTDYIINCQTGIGKTILALKIASELKVPFLVVVPRDRLMQQWKDSILKFTDIKEVGHIQQDVCDFEGKTACVGMVHSLSKDKYPEAMKNYFGLIVFDECLHPSHELLTPEGWVSVENVTSDTLVCQYDAYSERVSFVRPQKIIKKHFNGELVRFHNSRVDLLGTPNHEQPYFRKRSNGDWVLGRNTFENLNFYNNDKFWIPVCGYSEGNRILSWNDRFLVMLQADGHILNVTKKGKYCIRFSFRKNRKIERCICILEKAGIPYRVSVNSREDTNIYCYVAKFLAKKFFDWVDLYSGKQYTIDFIDELCFWDGWVDSRNSILTYVNTSKRDIDIVQSLCVMNGVPCSVLKYERSNLKHSDFYYIRFLHNKKAIINAKRIKKNSMAYSGFVYCVSVPTGNIITRRNNKVCVTGNCHTLAATTFSEVAKMFPAKYRVGLSATLHRQDEMEDVYFYHLGKNIVSTEQKTQPAPKVFIYEYPGFSGRLPFWLDRTDAVKTRACILSNLADNQERNQVIAKLANQLIGSDRQTLVIGDRIKQLQAVEKLITDDKKGLYISKTSAKQKYWLEKQGMCILATTKMLDIGIDIDTLRGLIFATPRSEAEQIVGRIRRINPAVKEPVVVDIYDTCYPECERWFKKRLKYYTTEGFEIVKL
jgi:superfamily II DNA or RNA helicase